MIELKLEQLVSSVSVLQKLSTKPLKARTAFMVAKLLQNADNEVNNFNDARMNLITKYGVKDDNGELKTDDTGSARIVQEHLPEFNTELQELLNTSITINATKIAMKDIENLEFTPGEILQLEPFLEI